MQVKKVHWCPPPDGVIKVNFDAAFKTETYQGASGVVLRNAQGQFVAAKCKQHGSIPDALTAEAYAYHDAALLIKDLGLTKVIVEMDCQELVALWNSRTSNRCAIIPVLNQIQELSRQCTHFVFAHVRRGANMAAHYTANFALISNSECVWLHDILNFLSQCIQQGSHARSEGLLLDLTAMGNEKRCSKYVV
jgi:ribonuclease HI